MMENLYELIAVVGTFLIGLVAGAVRWRKFKKVVTEFSDTIEATNQLINTITTALEDDRLTKEEVKAIVTSAQNVIKEFEEFTKAVRDLVSN